MEGLQEAKEENEVTLSTFAKAAGCSLGGGPPKRVKVENVFAKLAGRVEGGSGKDLIKKHLGGFITNDSATFEYRMWNWALSNLAVNPDAPNILDIGCGMGFSTDYFLHESRAQNGHVLCLEGSETAMMTSLVPCNVIQVDFAAESYKPRRVYDIAWSCEMLEHVSEKYMPNYMQAFQQARYAIVTHGDVGQAGFHHVNNQDQAYWIEKFNQYGFDFESNLTVHARTLADPSWGYTYQCSEWSKMHPSYNPKCAVLRKGRPMSHFHDKGLVFSNRKFSVKAAALRASGISSGSV